MAALRGTLEGNRGTVSRLGSKNSGICSELNTWNGTIVTRLEANGEFTVLICEYLTDDPRKAKVISKGNVDTLEVA